jgi:hypothetical protein
MLRGVWMKQKKDQAPRCLIFAKAGIYLPCHYNVLLWVSLAIIPDEISRLRYFISS